MLITYKTEKRLIPGIYKSVRKKPTIQNEKTEPAFPKEEIQKIS